MDKPPVGCFRERIATDPCFDFQTSSALLGGAHRETGNQIGKKHQGFRVIHVRFANLVFVGVLVSLYQLGLLTFNHNLEPWFEQNPRRVLQCRLSPAYTQRMGPWPILLKQDAFKDPRKTHDQPGRWHVEQALDTNYCSISLCTNPPSLSLDKSSTPFFSNMSLVFPRFPSLSKPQFAVVGPPAHAAPGQS